MHHKEETNNETYRFIMVISAMMLFFAISSLPMITENSVITSNVFEPEQAYALTIGDEQVQGWAPSDIVNTDDSDVNIDPSQATVKLEQTVIKLVKILLPLLMIAGVCILIYNAARNIFKKPEDQVKMGDLIKNMFVQFFFILFAWIIVEGIVFIVTNGETILFSTLLS